MTPEGKACQAMIEHALTLYRLPASADAVRLLCMISAHESGGFRYVQQIGGPALSLFHVEPVTYCDVCNYCVRKNLYFSKELPSPVERLIFDSTFAAGLARIFFLRFPEPIPDTPEKLAVYAKLYWNTPKGKACSDDYLNAWKRYFAET